MVKFKRKNPISQHSASYKTKTYVSKNKICVQLITNFQPTKNREAFNFRSIVFCFNQEIILNHTFFCIISKCVYTYSLKIKHIMLKNKHKNNYLFCRTVLQKIL